MITMQSSSNGSNSERSDTLKSKRLSPPRAQTILRSFFNDETLSDFLSDILTLLMTNNKF